MPMDMTQFAGEIYLRAQDIRASGPTQVAIEDIKDGRFGKPVAVLSDGTSLQLNATNTRALVRVWGPNSADWIGREIELSVGPVPYKGEVQDGILVRPISPPIPLSERKRLKPPEPALTSPIDDDIPF